MRTIEISVQPVDETIELLITGNGVAESIRSSLFEPFVTTKRNNGGNGLSLNIAQNLIRERLHGTIELVSPPEGVAQWRIILPPKLPSQATNTLEGDIGNTFPQRKIKNRAGRGFFRICRYLVDTYCIDIEAITIAYIARLCGLYFMRHISNVYAFQFATLV